MQLEHDHGTELDQKVLDAMMSMLSSNLIFDDFVNPPPSCMPICLDQAVRSVLLKEMPTLDDKDVVVRQVGDMSWGVQVRGTDAADGQGGPSTTSGSGNGKEKEVSTGPSPKARSWSPSRDSRAPSKPITPSEKRRG
jgi:hypothetical protein